MNVVFINSCNFPGVAQIGSALEWGSRGRWFDSSHSDKGRCVRHRPFIF